MSGPPPDQSNPSLGQGSRMFKFPRFYLAHELENLQVPVMKEAVGSEEVTQLLWPFPFHLYDEKVGVKFSGPSHLDYTFS